MVEIILVFILLLIYGHHDWFSKLFLFLFLPNASQNVSKKNIYKQEEIIQMVDFLIYNIFVPCDIPIDTNCAPLLADLFLHAYEADFLQGLLKNKDRN